MLNIKGESLDETVWSSFDMMKINLKSFEIVSKCIEVSIHT